MTTADKPVAAPSGSHRWRFFRAGGFDQVLLETGADLTSLGSLDQKLWAALSCPVAGIEFDRRTLEFVDSDADGHIRPPELIAAAEWAGKALKDPDILVRRPDRIPLSAIRDTTDEGRTVLAGAKLVLEVLGRSGEDGITVEDAGDTARIFAEARFNGDGVVPPRAAGDPALQAAIEDVLASLGGANDRSGAPGVAAAEIERFYADAVALRDWWDAGGTPGTRPFGEDTAARFELFRTLQPKIDDYFRRCRLAEYDGRAGALLAPPEEEYRKLSAENLGGTLAAVEAFPIAVPAAGKAMPLCAEVNPAFCDAVGRFRAEVVEPVLGNVETLREEDWGVVRARFAPYEGWLAAKPATPVEALGEARVRQLLSEGGRAALLDLVERDRAVEPEFTAIASVEKLARYCRDLHLLADNFVSFREFYSGRGKATFQAGTLYLDGRSVELCVPVADVTAHVQIASPSRIFLVYCACTRRGGEEKMTIAAGFTAGDSDFLTVGRNGVFYDRKGQDWDATIVRTVDQPISIRQAFWAPYKRIARMIGEQVQKLAAARSRASEERAGLRMIQAGEQAAAGKPPAPPSPPFDIAKFAGIFAAIGLAIGAIGAVLLSAITGLFRLALWQIPLVFAVVILIVSAPSVLLAWLKLRKRNLAPVLDANGWAVNARAKINVPFGASLTARARLPANAERSMADPFAEKKRPWAAILLLLVLLGALLALWWMGYRPAF